MLVLKGDRDYQVTLDDLKGWRNGSTAART
jgi:hypothetical protein